MSVSIKLTFELTEWDEAGEKRLRHVSFDGYASTAAEVTERMMASKKGFLPRELAAFQKILEALQEMRGLAPAKAEEDEATS